MNLFGITDLYPENQNQQGVVIDGILKSITQYFAHQYNIPRKLDSKDFSGMFTFHKFVKL